MELLRRGADKEARDAKGLTALPLYVDGTAKPVAPTA
jgi:hypothetical protein